MNEAERWHELERLYHEALNRIPDERAEFLDHACAGDSALREEIQSLLDHRPETSFLDPPSLAAVAHAVAASDTETGVLAPGTQVGPYQIVERIGRGGMGMVYRAEQQHPVRRQVALKMINPGMDSEQAIARFEAERQTLALMDHPNIARVFDAGATSAGRLYFVMELVDGLPLMEYCEQHALNIADRLWLLLPVCEAIEHAHQKGIIHRDIKPTNVLVAEFNGKPVPKVIDFGIAKTLEQRFAGRMETQAGAVIGTLAYMSPEQAGSLGHDIDTRSDVYSLGAVLYELITGHPPLHDETGQEPQDVLIRRLRESVPPPPSARLSDLKLARQVRGDLDWVVMKALEKERARRYASVGALGADIANYLAGMPVAAGPPSVLYRLGKAARRHRGAVAAVAAIALLIAAGVVMIARAAIVARRAQQEAAAVSEFLQHDLLAQASANVQASSTEKLEKDLLVRTALDRAAARIGSRFAGQPLVEAAIRQTIGATYLDLGMFPEGRTHLERAIELRRRELGDRHPSTLEAENLLVNAYLGQGKLAEAERLAKRVLEDRRRLLGENHPDTLTSLHNTAAVERAYGRNAEAEPLFRKAAEQRRQMLGPSHPDTLASLNNLAVVSILLEKYQQAIDINQQVLEVRRRTLGEEHPDTVQSRYTLGLALMNGGQPARAAEVLSAVLSWRRRVLGPAHVETLSALNALGMVEEDEGQYALSENHFKECLDLSAKTLGAEHPTARACSNNLALTYMNAGRYEESIRELRRLQTIQEKILGAESPDALRGRSNLAAVLGYGGHYGEARELFLQVVEQRRRVLGPKNPKTLSSMSELAGLYKRMGHFAEAEKGFREVVALRREVLGGQHPNTRVSMTSLAYTLLERGKYVEAESLLREVMASPEADAWTRGLRQNLLGWALKGQGRMAEAEPLLEAGYQALDKQQGSQPLLDRVEVGKARARLR